MSNRAVLKLVPINAAEAIFAPLFDARLVEFSEFTLEEEDGAGGTFGPTWDGSVLRTTATQFLLRWRGHLLLTGYDSIRLFINFPPHIRLSGWATVGGKRKELFRDMPGEPVPCEPTSPPLKATAAELEVTEMELRFVSSRSGETLIGYYWAGAVDSTREPLIERALPRYSATWPGLLNPAGKAGLTVPLMGSKQALMELKARAHSPAFQPLLSELKRAATQWEQYAPEKDIREFVPCVEHLFRYVRVRDRGRPIWEDGLNLLALAGYLCEREDWSHLAARLMLSVVRTPHWFEGPQGCFPGSGWHHVCFMEAHFSSALCFALQFTGNLLTPDATRLILDRIEEAWRLINARCEEPGYRWYMNQGLVFNSDRLLAAMTLYRYGRGDLYAANVEQSYRDHTTILHNYVSEDGHITEGGYYPYSFGSSLRLWLAYAEHAGRPVADILPPRFLASVAFVEASTSSVGDAGYMIPHGAGGARPWPGYLVAFLAAHCGWTRGWTLLRNRLAHGTQDETLSGMDAFLQLLTMPAELPATTARPSGLVGCPSSGLVAYEFPPPHCGKLLVLCERPATGHHHQDRGSIVLEANGEILLLDPGTLNYSHLQCTFMGNPDWHNLAHPVGLTMQVHDTIPPNPARPRATSEQVEATATGFRFTTALAAIYGPQVREGRREGDLQLTAGGGRLALRDRWGFAEPRAVELTFQSLSPWVIDGQTAHATIGGTRMVIQVRESQNRPLKVTHLDDRVDSNEHPVYTLKITTEPAQEIDLCSEVVFQELA